MAVLAIVITAPIGSLLIALIGPRLLHKREPEGSATSSQSAEAVEKRESKPNSYINQAVSVDDE